MTLCHACLQAAPSATACACCGRTVCESCRDEIGGLTHCPECAADAREFINGGETHGLAPQMPDHGQEQLPW